MAALYRVMNVHRIVSMLSTRVFYMTKAVCCRYSSAYEVFYKEYGDPTQMLMDREVSINQPLKENQVLVKMKLSPINPSDINMVQGAYAIKPPLPAVAGNECVGEVIEIGPNVKQLRVGDWVNPIDSGFGTWRSLALCDEIMLSKVPSDIPVLGAAMLSVNFCTAYRILKDFVDLHPGDIVIQNLANSCVGRAVIQLCREWGFVTINIVRNRLNIEELRSSLMSLGADHVITEKFSASSEMKTFLQSFASLPKLGLNGVGGKSAAEVFRSLKNRGTLVTYGGMSRKPFTFSTGSIIFKELQAFGYWNSQWNSRNKDTLVKQQMIDELCDLMRSEKLVFPPTEMYPLTDYRKAVSSAKEEFKSCKIAFKMY